MDTDPAGVSTPSPARLLEVCVGSVADARAAEHAGADRLELCGALELGGLTPSIGLVESVVGATRLPTLVMLRARASGFCYDEDETRCMAVDARRLIDAGASGVVFGGLERSGGIDESLVQRLVETAGPRETVFHRAFDSVERKPAALERLAELGVTRVLTSGGGAKAVDGLDSLRELVSTAEERIEIIAAGGITAADACRILGETGCRQIHVGASVGRADDSIRPDAAAGLCDLKRLAAGAYRAVDRGVVSEVRRALRSVPR